MSIGRKLPDGRDPPNFMTLTETAASAARADGPETSAAGPFSATFPWRSGQRDQQRRETNPIS